MTHTDPLDAWIYFNEGASQQASPKPVFELHEAVLELVDFLQDGKKPGWFRFSADLLNIAGDSQEALAVGVKKLVRETKADGRPHHYFVGFAGAWGYPALFVGTMPPECPWQTPAAIWRPTGPPRHQIKSDRALMVLIDERGKSDPFATTILRLARILHSTRSGGPSDSCPSK